MGIGIARSWFLQYYKVFRGTAGCRKGELVDSLLLSDTRSGFFEQADEYAAPIYKTVSRGYLLTAAIF